MTVAILHLSDIHIRTGHDNPILRRSTSIAAAIAGSDPLADSKVADLIIALTGDVAFAGAPEEYAQAAIFLGELKREVLSRCPHLTVHIVCVPGNHDCDFRRNNSVRDLIIEQFNPTTADGAICAAATAIQQPYWDFAATQMATVAALPTAYARTTIRLSSSREVAVQLLNTAITSRLSERPGNLYFPMAALPQVADFNDATLVLTLCHHPYGWLEPNNARALRSYVETTSDVILTGHEHDPGVYKKEKLTHGPTELNQYFEGGVLQEHGEPHLSSFNLVFIDQDSQKQAIHEFSWSKDMYRGTTSATNSAFHRNSARLRARFALASEFETQLLDPGANYTHPKKSKLTLLDIYVYPFVREFDMVPNADGGVGKIVTRPLEYVLEKKNVLIRGGETAGKTALAKKLFLDLRQAGAVPILVPGQRFTSESPEDVSALEFSELGRQYSGVDPDSYRQLPKTKRLIIVDDFHHVPLKPHRRNALLEVLCARFDIVVLLSADELGVEELLEHGARPPELWSFRTAALLEFGHLQRSELVEQWLKLSRDVDDNPATLYSRQVSTENLLTQLVGKNLVPAYPAFLLIVLQQLEARIPLETEAGSVGYFYEVLITQSLNRVAGSRTDIDTQYSYLSELAKFMFDGASTSADIEAVRPWHQALCERYHLKIPFERSLHSLQSAGILVVRNGRLSFRYQYIYYYFVGRYLHTHIAETSVQATIQEMCTRLYHESTANIMVFLCYLSKDAFVLDSLLLASRALYPDERDCDLCLSQATVRSLLSSLPTFRLNDKTPQENRRNALSKRDEQRYREISTVDQEQGLTPEAQPEEYGQVAAPFLQLNAAFKTIQILGQILREFAGSIEGARKIELLNECYSLGLRVLNWILRLLDQSKDELVDVFGGFLTDSEPRLAEAPERLEKKIRDMIFGLMERLSFIVVKHIAASVGLKRLAITFERILSTNPDVPRRVIDVAIRLDHFDEFPEKQVLELRRELEDNILARTLLQHLVWEHFLMFPENYQLRQRICEKLDIKVQSPRLLDSRMKKTQPKSST